VPELTVEPNGIAAAIATLEDVRSVDATLRLLREERSRLYRTLRKLSFLDPLPSWGPFLAARVAIGGREAIVTGLSERGIHVYAPEQVGLEGYIRFGIGSPSEMEQLRAALLDLAPEILG
jgi:histidinol-phosphate/aromatic aminotransferase/cobyric acid decarboxylase-like protein